MAKKKRGNNMIKLSILIPTLPKRNHMLDKLLQCLIAQHKGGQVEIVINDDVNATTGEKRNALIRQAKGEYIVFVDDDDEVTSDYIPKILEATQYGCDAIGISGFMTTDGQNKINWRISKNYPYKSVRENGREVYLRFNNHLSPIKREIALQFLFPDVSSGEDYAWAKAIHDSNAIKTEATVEGNIYHYKFITKK